jgi:CRISPR system Cascade subunit CasE
MYFSRVTIVPQLIPRKVLANLIKGNCYSDHQLLWRLFDDDKRQYIFRKEVGVAQPEVMMGQSNSLPVYYIVSKHQPVACDGLDIMSKPYQPKLLEGERFGFSVRVNPIVAKKVVGKKNRVHHDILMEAKTQAKEQGLSIEQRAGMVDQAGKDWLIGRAQSLGFSVEEDLITCDGYQQHRFYKGKNNKPISLSTLDYNGVLTVTNAEVFSQRLFEGIGRAKAFGCGLMMIRRV